MTARIPHEIIERASEWLIELREPAVAPEMHERFCDWLRQSPVHVQAYLEATALWEDSAKIDRNQDLGIEAALRAGEGTSNVLSLQTSGTEGDAAGDSWREERLTAAAPARPQEVSRARIRPLMPFAAGLVLILAAGAAVWWQLARAPVYRADIGEQRIVTLDDGSLVRLNSRSELRVRLTPEQRTVELIAGQALFEVAKDAARPFLVRSGEVTIRALGTAFDVHRKASGTIVTVVEGRVEVSNRRTASVSTLVPLALSAGEQAAVTSTGVIQRVPKPNVAAATSWLQHELIFTGEPLSAVVEEFNRYSRRPIVLSDPALADLRINAVFHSTNPDGLLRFFSRHDGIEITETETEIRIDRREAREQ